jgi:hypothetical protein
MEWGLTPLAIARLAYHIHVYNVQPIQAFAQIAWMDGESTFMVGVRVVVNHAICVLLMLAFAINVNMDC